MMPYVPNIIPIEDGVKFQDDTPELYSPSEKWTIRKTECSKKVIGYKVKTLNMYFRHDRSLNRYSFKAARSEADILTIQEIKDLVKNRVLSQKLRLVAVWA